MGWGDPIDEEVKNPDENKEKEDSIWMLDLQQSSIANNRIAEVVPENVQAKKQEQKKVQDEK